MRANVLALPIIGWISSDPTIDTGMIGDAGLEGGGDEAAPAEALQLVALAVVGLPIPLNPSGKTPTSSPLLEQPLGIGVAGQRGAGLAGDRPDHRRGEDQVGSEQAQEPVLRMLLVDADREHRRVQWP